MASVKGKRILNLLPSLIFVSTSTMPPRDSILFLTASIPTPRPETFAHAEFASTLDLQPGDTVLAMGAPWGLSNSMSAGVVNNPRRLLVSLFDDEADYEDRLGADQPTGRYYAWIQFFYDGYSNYYGKSWSGGAARFVRRSSLESLIP